MGYDKPLRAALETHGFSVVTADFSLTDTAQALADIQATVEQVQRTTPSPVCLVGVSSGAFYAHLVANRMHLPALLLCPVLTPWTRHAHLSASDQRLQLKAFQTLHRMQEWESRIDPPNRARAVITGVADTVRGSHPPWQTRRVLQCRLEGGHELTTTVPLDVMVRSLRFLESHNPSYRT